MHIAILGVSKNKTKYGYKVLKNLITKKLQIYPINPKYDKILGEKCYPSLTMLPTIPDFVVFIVPPKIGLATLKEVKKLNIKKVWFQPGAESPEIEKYCIENNLDYSFYKCIMVIDLKH